jgi:NAD(P)-dependent dehydrogenase (short-subunit alcohol dehydrogenase family)
MPRCLQNSDHGVNVVVNYAESEDKAKSVAVNCVAPGFMEGTRMTSNRPPDYVATVTDLTLLRHAVSKDDVAEHSAIRKFSA